jgi:uncharacterized protein (DUF924 family)
MNLRWIYQYFDVLALKLTRQLYALPPALRPANIERLMAQGWSFEYSMIARIWLTTPLVHSEDFGAHDQQLILTEEMRKLIEERFGRTDPNRITDEKDMTDICAFPRLIRQIPVEEGTKFDDFMFWHLRMVKVHTPILHKFERNPFCNNVIGRDSTEEELQYAKDTNYYGIMRDKEVVRRIRADVDARRWTPLQDEPVYSDVPLDGDAAHS